MASALEDDFGPRQVRHRLHDAGKVVARIGPVRDFTSEEQLQRFRPPDRLRARRPNGVAAVQAVAGQLLRIRRSRVGLHQIGTMLVKSIGHIKQVVGGILSCVRALCLLRGAGLGLIVAIATPHSHYQANAGRRRVAECHRPPAIGLHRSGSPIAIDGAVANSRPPAVAGTPSSGGRSLACRTIRRPS